MYGKKVQIDFTSARHYCIYLNERLGEEDAVKSNIVFICSNIKKKKLKLHWNVTDSFRIHILTDYFLC